MTHSLSARVAIAPSVQRGNPVHQLERVSVGREPAKCKVRFGNFEVDLRSRELRKHGVRIRLAEKPFQILELLLEHAGGVVTRKALRDKLWPDTHVGYEHSLNTAVNTLREMLGDSAQNPRYIETIPRLGYRFVCAVTENTTPAAAKKLAVLPFENLSSNQEQEHFADGLTEEIISRLGQLDTRRLGVIARTTSIQYKRTQKSVLEIALELGVDIILEGSVRRSGETLRITAQLIDCADQTHVWTATFDRELGNSLAIQSEVAKEIGSAASRELLGDQSTKPGEAAIDKREKLRVANGGD